MKTMEAFKFRLVPMPEQEKLLSRHAGCVRFVQNKALDLQEKRLDAGIPLLSCGDLAKLLTLGARARNTAFSQTVPRSPSNRPSGTSTGPFGKPWTGETRSASHGSKGRARGIPSGIPIPSR